MGELVGYDIDGVLTRTDTIWDLTGAVVISGRTFAEYDDTAKQAAQLCPVYIRGVGTYGDRHPLQAEIIRWGCPDCEVVEVK